MNYAAVAVLSVTLGFMLGYMAKTPKTVIVHRDVEHSEPMDMKITVSGDIEVPNIVCRVVLPDDGTEMP